jgi:Ferritin-like
LSRDLTAQSGSSFLTSLSEAVDFFGIPYVEGASPLEEACRFLLIASDVEHSVFIEYLYAAYSLGLSPLATKITSIAIQEMCHFLTVQNLLLFAGAHPSVLRQDQAPQPDYDPFQFSLRPFSKTVLEDFILAEMPPLNDMSDVQRLTVQKLIEAREKQRRRVHQVGVIYMKLYWLLQADDSPTLDWTGSCVKVCPRS